MYQNCEIQKINYLKIILKTCSNSFLTSFFQAPKEPLPYSGEYHAVNRDVICAQPSPQKIALG